VDFALVRGGIAVGLAVAAPVGPIGVLVIRRSVRDGRACGFFTGMGAATADALYALLGAFTTSLAAHLVARSSAFRVGGGVLLCAIGLKMLFAKPLDARGHEAKKMTWASAFASSLALTLTNPATILIFAVVSASLGLGTAANAGDLLVLVASVFVGSALWWLILSTGAAWIGERLGPRAVRAIGFVSAACVVAFGVAALIRP
jgi:threonine/homoserine/homoserine lactone efflux protein